jgi:hypothetical protein
MGFIRSVLNTHRKTGSYLRELPWTNTGSGQIWEQPTEGEGEGEQLPLR